MKFIHLSDLHIGKRLREFSLLDDQKYILLKILGVIDDEKPDAVLIAGDVYDKGIPSEKAVNLFDDFLTRLAKKKIPVFVISGNHDSDDRLNYGSKLFENCNIYISAIYDGQLNKCEASDDINIYLLPFVKASKVKHFYPDAKIENYEDEIRVIIDNADIDPSKCNILVAHQFVAGKGEGPALGGSESAGTKNVGLVEQIGYDCFDMFDYVALGHIHSPQRIGRDEVRYAGSPLKYSLTEAYNEKAFTIITVNGKDNISIDLIPIKPMRDLRHIKGTMEELLSKENVVDTQDFIWLGHCRFVLLRDGK